MRIQPFATQLRRLVAEYAQNGSIFGIDRSLFHRPTPGAPFGVANLFGKPLDTPVGPSAGPHTQLSQNIVAAFLCGARFVELKTVQVRDRLEIPRPCIDMADEGYNVEWSQELALEESAHEYVAAWALVHLLPRLLGWDDPAGSGPSVPGVIFDMSVGYDLQGIGDPRMARFMDTLADASEAIDRIKAAVEREFPQFRDLTIPPAVVNSVTLSTMHGCPPSEIERIARHLLEERGLHTVVKLNPTLLGREAALDILHGSLGFADIEIPEAVFDHDLRYDAAVDLISSLGATAARRGLRFGVKLSNTLPVRNRAGRLPGAEMYMSGRALYPVTMSLFDRLLHDFDGNLQVSYSGGADASNLAAVLSCGALPVTGCSDLLKPGGVARFAHWLEALRSAMAERGASNLDQLAADRLANVHAAADEALANPRYKKAAFVGQPKLASALAPWDCVVAPCAASCPVEQDVPGYAWLIAAGEYDRALRLILARNPLPGVTGYVCTRICESRCTRNDYEESVAIRALKRAAEERGRAAYAADQGAATARSVAVIGSGPSGLAASAFLALHGVGVTIFEARDVAGGMMRLVPPFRLPSEIIERDIARITDLGVAIRLNTRIATAPEGLLADGFDAVYVASGFQRDAPLKVPGADGPGVVPALRLLDRSRRGERVDLGRRAVVVGGGDTAMDAARTAQRLTGAPVTLLYRRTRREMPAAAEELEGALEEGTILEELVSPIEIVRTDLRVTGIRCVRNRLGEPGADGRPAPVAIPGSEFVVPCDSVVVAVGQLPELSFLDGSAVRQHRSGGLLVDVATGCAGPAGIYAGGDVAVEPGSIISACADGRRAAESICRQLGIAFDRPDCPAPTLSDDDVLGLKKVRARRLPRVQPHMLPPAQRTGSALVESTLRGAEARAEADRCIQCSTFCDKCVEVCPNRANYTFLVEPVRWVLPVLAPGGSGFEVVGREEFRVSQRRQILHVRDFCNECGNCATFCVHQGRPYTDKPRLFLDAAAFATEASNAFSLQGHTLRRREQGRERRLTLDATRMAYEDHLARVVLTPEWRVEAATFAPASDGTLRRDLRLSLKAAAEMRILYEGITRSLPFLLVH